VDGTFRTIAEARGSPLAVAAANWMATATIALREFPDAVLIDVGSTTTDIVPLVAGRVAARGRTDTDRLREGELVYTGATRTPVCAILDVVSLGGGPCRVAAEVFAIAADAHLWLGLLDEAGYTSETPDGGGRDRRAASRRLARMVCADREMLDDGAITRIAKDVVEAQVRAIRGGIEQVLQTVPQASGSIALPIGRGAYLARAAAESAGLRVPEDPVLPDGPAPAIAILAAESVTARMVRNE
jgi:probable H4MPT-linked C1 transfer pathway protein